MKIKTIFVLVLKQARKEKGISQKQLAFDSNLDRSYISKLETGVYQPSISTIFTISEVLDIKPSDLIKEVYLRYLKQRTEYEN
ncbi:SOS-response repressor and protease LexA (EC 3.4.21.88) [uncultured Gammaproteobacteria bacterium]|nr:SOS-response repressor and protease LexA (EC 3.4.21.88) [uncultured Gammaproteobacteria bacterium]